MQKETDIQWFPEDPDEPAATLLYRFWDVENNRLAMWKVWMFGSWEYHVRTPRETIIEAFTEEYALSRAGAARGMNPERYRRDPTPSVSRR